MYVLFKLFVHCSCFVFCFLIFKDEHRFPVDIDLQHLLSKIRCTKEYFCLQNFMNSKKNYELSQLTKIKEKGLKKLSSLHMTSRGFLVHPYRTLHCSLRIWISLPLTCSLLWISGKLIPFIIWGLIQTQPKQVTAESTTTNCPALLFSLSQYIYYLIIILLKMMNNMHDGLFFY